MTPKQFRAWMKQQDLRVADVASATRLSTNTIYAFLRGDSVQISTKDHLNRFAIDYGQRKQSHARSIMEMG